MPRPTLVSHWWAQRWVELLDELSWEFEGRLAKARTFARNGSVTQLRVAPGSITAQVYGSWGDRYTVRIVLPAFSREAWERITDALAGEASYVARLLAQELPRELDDVCARSGVALYPSRLGEISASCTCPDAANPCKHTLAVLYAFAIRLDTDPSLLLQLRGRSAVELTAKVRERWSAEGDGAAATPESDAAEAGALRPNHFFEPGPELETFVATFRLSATPPPINAAVLARIGLPSFAGANEDPHEILAPIYQTISERALLAAKRSAKKTTRARSKPAARRREQTGD